MAEPGRFTRTLFAALFRWPRRRLDKQTDRRTLKGCPRDGVTPPLPPGHEQNLHRSGRPVRIMDGEKGISTPRGPPRRHVSISPSFLVLSMFTVGCFFFFFFSFFFREFSTPALSSIDQNGNVLHVPRRQPSRAWRVRFRYPDDHHHSTAKRRWRHGLHSRGLGVRRRRRAQRACVRAWM